MITLTGNFGSFYAVSIMALISPILPLLPTQVLVENILTDIPMFGTIRAQVPRKEQRRPFHYSIRGVGFAATILGLVVLSSQLVFYFMFSHLSLPLFRTLWLLEVVLIEFSLVISLRTTDWFWKAGLLSLRMRLFFAFVILFTLLLPFIPYLSLWLHLEPYPLIYLVPIAVIVASAMILVELVKKLLFHSSFFHHR
jgi:Mg2+-importing ATPase